MLKASHVNIGGTVAFASIVATAGYISPLLVFYPLFSLLPDADHHSSSATKAFGFQLPGATHRGYSHSALFVVAVALVIYYGLSYFFPGILTTRDLYILLAVSFSHLLGDLFTKKRIPLFYPFYKGNIGIPLFTTGSIVEKLITFVVSIVNIGLLGFIATNYIVPQVATTIDVPNTFLAIALLSQAWIFYLLFKDEIVFFKKNVKTVFSHLTKTILFIAGNAIFLVGAYHLVIKTGIIDTTAIASSMGMSNEVIIALLGVIGMTPSAISTLRHIDELSFPFASALNIITGLFVFGTIIVL